MTFGPAGRARRGLAGPAGPGGPEPGRVFSGPECPATQSWADLNECLSVGVLRMGTRVLGMRPVSQRHMYAIETHIAPRLAGAHGGGGKRLRGGGRGGGPARGRGRELTVAAVPRRWGKGPGPGPAAGFLWPLPPVSRQAFFHTGAGAGQG